MSAPAISIRNLGKRYRVNHAVARAPYRTLRDSLTRAATAPLRRLRGETNGTTEDFWALKDVTFDVQPGEVVGIIGHNGAGKSTLLKILSRITKPTTGEVELNGRVASLLEVGTGFHPELTGRENIFLNGSILGMLRKEIERNFDEIVVFAGVEKFLDTPVKRYSSGMYVRLAFAVAAHLEPEILIVDEVLAVGDAAFQAKCVGKIGQLVSGGRTVLLVSHQLAMLSHLATEILWLDGGVVRGRGMATNIIQQYSALVMDNQCVESTIDLSRHPNRRRGSQVTLSRLSLFDSIMRPTTTVTLGDPLNLMVELCNIQGRSDHAIGIEICDEFGSPIGIVQSRVQSTVDLSGATRATLRCRIDSIRLLPGSYRLNAWLGDAEAYIDRIDDAATFLVDASDIFGTGVLPIRRYGPVVVEATWSHAP